MNLKNFPVINLFQSKSDLIFTHTYIYPCTFVRSVRTKCKRQLQSSLDIKKIVVL